MIIYQLSQKYWIVLGNIQWAYLVNHYHEPILVIFNGTIVLVILLVIHYEPMLTNSYYGL